MESEIPNRYRSCKPRHLDQSGLTKKPGASWRSQQPSQKKSCSTGTFWSVCGYGGLYIYIYTSISTNLNWSHYIWAGKQAPCKLNMWLDFHHTAEIQCSLHDLICMCAEVKTHSHCQIKVTNFPLLNCLFQWLQWKKCSLLRLEGMWLQHHAILRSEGQSHLVTNISNFVLPVQKCLYLGQAEQGSMGLDAGGLLIWPHTQSWATAPEQRGTRFQAVAPRYIKKTAEDYTIDSIHSAKSKHVFESSVY